jgi:hypothetical protein
LGSVYRKSKSRRHLTPLEWPSTPEVDAFRWELGPEPSDADADWATQYLNTDADADDGPATDDPIWDVWADEAAALDRIQRGFCL